MNSLLDDRLWSAPRCMHTANGAVTHSLLLLLRSKDEIENICDDSFSPRSYFYSCEFSIVPIHCTSS
jgi:hypothetical protein